jgi:glycine amidinotransferase
MKENQGGEACPVSSFNEWDPLEEVIVGDMRHAMIPSWEIPVAATMPDEHQAYFINNAAQPFPHKYVELACEELDRFSETLEGLGITVRRPVPTRKDVPFSTPHWRSAAGLYSAMPRDSLLVVGDTVIEAPMAWRSRYHEVDAFRPLLKDYFRRGAKWIAAPKPQLSDKTFREVYDKEAPYVSKRYAVTEFEPTFDAADFVRCGKDIFAQMSHVTNAFGIEWVRRHLGPDYRVHVVDVMDSAPMHIDATMVPLAPGKLMAHPERLHPIPEQFKGWEVRRPPEPVSRPGHTYYMSSPWLSMNVLMLNPTTVVVEKSERPTAKFLEDWGFDVVPVEFENVIRFGGAFHCVTADVRRTGSLQSYF